jgi:hypothetical protein
MKGALIGVLGLGLLVGYGAYPLLHSSETGDPGVMARVSSVELTPEQIDRIAARVAPAVVEQLASSGINGIAPDPRLAAQRQRLAETSREEQAKAFSQATALVDQMIANRQVTQSGLNDAGKLLEQSGQGDRAYELNARVAAAVNRNELTPAQAGYHVPETN